MAKMPSEITVPVRIDLDITVTAHGPIDGRHVIIVPDAGDMDDEVKDALVQQIGKHFTEAHAAHGYTGPAAGAVPLVAFGDARIEPA